MKSSRAYLFLVIAIPLLPIALPATDTGEKAMTIELLYFEGCPNYKPALAELEAALQALGMDEPITLLEREGESLPDYARGYGSPTVLVDGKDLFGEKPGDLLCCRFYGDLGYPQKSDIIEKLGSRQRENQPEDPRPSS